MKQGLSIGAMLLGQIVGPILALACDNDSQCKGDRVCDNGKCVEPAKPPPTLKKAHPKPKDEEVSEAPTPAAPARMKPEESAKTRDQTSGLALGIGLGYQNAGFGIIGAFYGQLHEAFRLAPYFGVGNLPTDKLSPWGFALGLMSVVGAGRHRFVFDLSYGLAGVYTTAATFPDTTTTSKPVYGISGAIGYEYMHGGGFFLRPLMWGYTGLTSDHGTQSGGVLTVQLFALGFKFW